MHTKKGEITARLAPIFDAYTIPLGASCEIGKDLVFFRPLGGWLEDREGKMAEYYEFEVTLKGIARLWRRFLLRKSATFLDLHEAIQDACGWENDESRIKS